ncbi:hypothetical protein HNR23_002644 [Nocardiopsis mwathae]|uniref:Prevent-host-death family protein n=1 Tax=Nocardiopsis mwathae TaxID=1472723 RepID=A0A7W9YI35_9ACTN|nr:DUF6247 family protein [Nocardiopsis mwathae]MBB6172584.1 hypothetical protein [Nocardiopsis mwathae]
MSASCTDTVSFSDLSRNPRSVAERARSLGRVRVTHRDAPDFYLIAADREDLRDQTLTTASRIFLAIAKQDPGSHSLELAIREVFPWVRHLPEEEVHEFSEELVAALSDAAELDTDTSVQEVIAGWRATARIKADPEQHRRALEPMTGDFGPVDVIA